MKVLFTSSSFQNFYKLRKEIVAALMNLGHEVIVTSPEDEFVPLLQDMGCRTIITPIDRRGTSPWNDQKLIRLYRKILRDERPAIVFSYTIKPNIYGGMACRAAGVPYVPNITGLGTSVQKNNWLRRITIILYRLGFAKAKHVFFQNRSNMETLLATGVIPETTTHELLPGSGINPEEFPLQEYPEDGPVRILYIGRIMREKGIGELFAAAKELRETHPQVEFILAGGCEEAYEEELKKLTDAGVLTYLGHVKDVRPHLEAAHAVILPSYHEGLANSLLEASATGRPVLATRIPGCEETFQEGITGFGFEKESAESLQEAVARFADLPYAKRNEMGRAAHEFVVKNFHRQLVVDAYVRQVDSVGKKEE